MRPSALPSLLRIDQISVHLQTKLMKTPSLFTLRVLQAVCLLLVGCATQAAEVKILCANGMQTVMEDLGPKFERATGHRLNMVFASGGAVTKRASEGEPVDVVIAPQPGVDALVKAGKVPQENVFELARTGISVAVRKGSAKPDISSPEALKRTLLSARSITYLDPKDGGASGVHFAKVLDRLGIAEEMKGKTILARKADDVGGMVARGEVEIGVLQFQLLFFAAGVEIVGPLPGDLQNPTVFAAAIMGGAVNDAEAPRALMAYLRTPEAVAVLKAKGMESVSR